MSTSSDREAIVEKLRQDGPLKPEDLYEWMGEALHLNLQQGQRDLRVLRRECRIVRDASHYRVAQPEEQGKLWEHQP